MRENLVIFHRMLGYRFVPESLAVEGEAAAGNTVTVKTLWNNRGSAPLYDEHHFIQYCLADSSGVITAWWDDPADLRKFLPGVTGNELEITIPEDIEKGEYDLLLSVNDRRTWTPSILLGIDGKRDDLRYVIGKIRI